MEWRGYPIADDCHPTRPWWRLRTVWIRSDGVEAPETTPTDPTLAEPELSRQDKGRPLASPKPRVGQVWIWESGDVAAHHLVVAVHCSGGEDRPVFARSIGSAIKAWPPKQVVACVAGPGSPWESPDAQAAR